MDESHLDTLRERIAQSRYEVDPQAVAAAIVERLALGGQRAAARVQARSLSSGAVLVAAQAPLAPAGQKPRAGLALAHLADPGD